MKSFAKCCLASQFKSCLPASFLQGINVKITHSNSLIMCLFDKLFDYVNNEVHSSFISNIKCLLPIYSVYTIK